ncbi:Protein CBG02723 [Caenorhabditis briggsae]|uniref:Protein CBG02723 n=1 Tax=Caenorhabditis briggsae TaxID=6238 RepID=A8WTN1_CAEBR|nr:Protein CBG02723 [Caenorhabditis briggsae]CAP23843.1 Protein CBG02723 [Caenorhabditis briggsae]
MKLNKYPYLVQNEIFDNMSFPSLFLLSCDISKFIEFVNRWKSGEAYQNLEYLKIRIVSHDVRQDEILNAIEAKHIDAQKTPLTHPLPRRYTEYTKQPNTDPIINHSYVVRESDNRVASFLIAKFWNYQMKLSKYPSLAQNEILDNMSFPCLFLFSFVSKSMKKLIKSSQLQRFKSIHSVEYDCCDWLSHYFNICYQSRIKETFTYAQKKETENRDKANRTDHFSLYVSGYIIDFRFSEYKSLVTTFHPYEKEHIIKSIHNYLISLIGDYMEYH